MFKKILWSGWRKYAALLLLVLAVGFFVIPCLRPPTRKQLVDAGLFVQVGFETSARSRHTSIGQPIDMSFFVMAGVQERMSRALSMLKRQKINVTSIALPYGDCYVDLSEVREIQGLSMLRPKAARSSKEGMIIHFS